ncbi:MAG: hypothetical protein Kow0099_27880 [Candidatus Abyssubacteria bacterium]
MRQSAGKILIWPMLVAAVAAAYFLLTYNRTLNPPDEGYLLYNYYKTASGQIPHLDFYDDYGPAIYWLGGALFRLFGTKIIVIRIFLVFLKSAMAVLIFLIGRKLMPTFFAIVASVLFILAWGDPLPPGINILYAGHVCHFLALVGVLAMMWYVETGARRWLIIIGICMGLSLLIKLPTGIMDLIGFSVFLSMAELVRTPKSESGEAVVPSQWRIMMRAGKCLGLVGVAAFYIILFATEHLDLYYFFIFLFPYFLLLGHLFRMEVGRLGTRRQPRDGALGACYLDVFLLWAVPLVSWVGVLVYYYLVGGLDEFLYDMFALPLAIDFYRPMDDYRLHAALAAAAAIAVFSLVFIGKRLNRENQTAGIMLWLTAAVLVVLPSAAMAALGTSYEVWHMRVTHVLPTATLLISAWFLLRALRDDRRDGEQARPTLFLALVFIFACQSFIMSFPRTDETHIQLNSTVVFILVAFLLLKMFGGLRSAFPVRGAVIGYVFGILCLAILSIPHLWSMKKLLVFEPTLLSQSEKERFLDYTKRHGDKLETDSYPQLDLRFPRASGLRIPLWVRPPLGDFVAADMVDTVRYVEENLREGEKVLVLCELQILPLLAERESLLQREDYFIFLATTELIGTQQGIRLTDENLMRRVNEEKPRFVILAAFKHSHHSQKVWDIWYNGVLYVLKNYRPVARFGIYQIWEPLSGFRSDE